MKGRGVALLIAAVILGVSPVVNAEGSQKSEWEIYDESYEWIDGKPAEHPDSSWSTVRSEIRDVLLEEREGDESPADDWWIYEEMPDSDAEQAERSRILKGGKSELINKTGAIGESGTASSCSWRTTATAIISIDCNPTGCGFRTRRRNIWRTSGCAWCR